MTAGSIDTSTYRRARAKFHAECKATDVPCWLCRMPIDYSLEWPDPDSFELDHLYPRSTHPEHTNDPANFRASHKLCNGKRGNAMPAATIGTPTRTWLR